MKSTLHRVVGILFVWGIVINCALVAALLAKRIELRGVREAYGRDGVGGTPPAPRAYRHDGTPVTLGSSGSGVAIWYAARECPYCQRDNEWPRLATMLREKGVEVAVLLPGGRRDEFSRETLVPADAEQIAYVSADWLRRYPLTMTPTVLIFDANWKLVWYEHGILRPGDAERAMAALTRAHRER